LQLGTSEGFGGRHRTVAYGPYEIWLLSLS
jgi:hypothetical protein